MSEKPLEPVPPALAKLFAQEARSYVEDPAAKEQVLRGCRSRAALLTAGGRACRTPLLRPGAVGGAATLKAWTAGKVAAIAGVAFVLGGVSGAAVATRWLAPQREATCPLSAATVSAPAPSFLPDRSSGGLPGPSATLRPAEASSAPGYRHTRSASASGVTFRNEPGTVAAKRARDPRCRPRRALAMVGWSEALLPAVHEHETRWPHGALEEEREVLAIRALARSGQTAAACSRAARFRRRFPASMLSDVVSSTLAKTACGDGDTP